ncbi:hypothetical protein Nepgr_020142 [Nepenthes gracilis]|uniref:Uncharacterized protein n=1 Tax=Nepenthes gracilis TaxID=150966 RepID=A0AAD3XW26_NEPGR|nr:hypothetical protein Nepgr_020142 [Nepenthes gracilis]
MATPLAVGQVAKGYHSPLLPHQAILIFVQYCTPMKMRIVIKAIPGIKAIGEDLIVSGPPPRPILKDDKSREEIDDDPTREVDSGGQRHHGGRAEEDRHVDKWNPFLLGERFVCKPNKER